MPHSAELVLVTPVWNDSRRLARFGPLLADAIARSGRSIDWIIADDGSDPLERDELSRLRDEFDSQGAAVRVHFAAEHRGKGAVIREAWSLETSAPRLAFVDADGAVTAGEMLRLIDHALDAGTSTIAVRQRTAQTRIVESPRRWLYHHAFIFATHVLLGLRCGDPQCGAKVISRGDFMAVSGVLREDGFAFDTELLATLQAHGGTWGELPVSWTEIKGGKVRPFRDGWRMLRALIAIRGRISSRAADPDRP